MMGLQSVGNNKVQPITSADSFFGKPELQQQVIEQHQQTKCAAGVLALRVPDPPAYAPPSICAISKDGKIAAVGGKDVELFLWSTETGELLSTLRGHETAWTGSNDNTFFVTLQEDSKVFIWDQQALRQRQLLGHPDEPLTSCSISLDDQYVVVGGARGTVYSWDSESGVEYRQYDDGHAGPVSTVMCYPMPDGTHVIISCGAADHTVVVWDLEAASKRSAVLIDELEHAKNVRYHISKDGTQVVAWCTDSVPFPNLIFVDALTGAKNSTYCHEGLVRHATFSKDAAKIISCGSDGKIVLWDTATLEPQITITGHVGNVLCCGINEEGSRIVSSGEDCTVRMWSTEDGMQLMQMQAQDEPVKFCGFAKSSSSNKILSCDVSGRVYVWNVISEVLASLIRRFADTISTVSMSSDNRLLAAGANNGRVMLWDAEQRENIWEYSHHTGRVECVAFNALRDLLASAGADGRVAVIAVDSGKQVNAFNGTDEPMMSIAFSPDDEKLAGVSADGKLLIFEVSSQDRSPTHVLSSNLGARVTSFTWSPNSKLIVGCGTDGCAMVWNATTGAIFTVLEGTTAATCCTFDVIGKLLAVGNVLGRTLLYNLETSEQLCELKGNASAVVDVVFNQDTTRITTICSRQAIIWDAATTQKIRVFDFVCDKNGDFQTPPHTLRSCLAHSGTIMFDHESEGAVFDMVPIEDPLLRSFYLSDTRMITCGVNSYKRVMVWSAASNSAPDKFHTTHDAITSCHFSLDDRLVAMGTQDGQIVVYDVLHHETIEVINAHQNGPCRCVRLSFDNSQILSCGADAKVILWDWRARQAIRIFTGHFVSIGSCDISFNDSRVVSGDNHGMISVWEKETGNAVQTMPLAHHKAVLSVSINADGSTVASVGADDKVAIWNVDNGQELVSLTAAIESHPLYCAFSADGNKLAVTESNGSVMVWNTFAGCQWYQIPHAHAGKVTSCSWSFDCRRFVTAGTDSVMAVWDAESGAPMFKFNVKTGALTTVSVSPQGVYVAGGSTTGTLSVCNIPQTARLLPEPSFLYNCLSGKEPKQAALLYTKLLSQNPYLPNVQDAQGWSLINHMVAKGNAMVSTIVMESVHENVGILGLISAVPFSITTRVQFHGTAGGDDGADADPLGQSGRLRGKSFSINSKRPPAAVAEGVVAVSSGKRRPTAIAGGTAAGSSRTRRPAPVAEGDEDEAIEPTSLIQKSTKSFSQQVKKVFTVELFTEKHEVDHMDLIMNNALALALNSKSSECVQVVLDATALNKVAFGSYHAITDMMPSLAVRYPYMCYQFLAQLDLAALGDLEVPVAVMRGLDKSVIRTAPIFTNVRNLWQSHLKLHEVRQGPQPYAHVKASMVRLPFACTVGKESLLQTLVESDVPVQAYGTPSVRAVIRHKWRLYARSKLLTRAIVYCIYTALYTVFCVLYAMEDHTLSLSELWDSGGRAKYQIVSGGVLFLCAAWFGTNETRQLIATGAHLYIKSGWNVLDMVSILLMLVIIPLYYTRTSMTGSNGVLGPLIAFEVVFTWFKTFFYALAFEPTGPVVHRVFQITYAVRAWAVLLFMNMVAFGAALMVLYQYTPSSSSFLDFGRALLTLYNSIFGVYDLSVNLQEGNWRQLAIIFWCFFLFFCNVVLLNMLIALMRDIYQEVRDREQDVFLKGRAELIVEVETLMTQAQLEEQSLAPPYVHMLTEVQRKVHNSDSLLGRLDRLEAMVGGMADSLSQLLRSHGMKPVGTAGGGVVVGRDGHPGTAGEEGRAAVQGATGMMGPNGMMMDPATLQMMMMSGMMPGMGGNPMFPGLMAPGMMGPGGLFAGMGNMMVMDPQGQGDQLSNAEQLNLVQLTAQRLKESESQLPAILRQIDRLQRTINNQEMRMEGVVIVLRDIENLLRNQQPVIIQQESRPQPRRNPALTEAELELEVKRLLGKGEARI